MKDARFIELVNLYIDRQISPEEQAELELEIQSSPRRRKTYLDYCRMHRATKLVYESFRASGAEGANGAAQPRTSIAHIADRARRRARLTYAMSGLAAAACVALVFVVGGLPSSNDSSESLAAARTTPAAPAVVAAAPAPTATPSASLPESGMATLRQAIFAEAEYSLAVAAFRAEQDRLLNPAARPANLSLFDDGVFDHRAGLPGRSPGQLNPRRAPGVQTEFTAFQFQR